MPQTAAGGTRLCLRCLEHLLVPIGFIVGELPRIALAYHPLVEEHVANHAYASSLSYLSRRPCDASNSKRTALPASSSVALALASGPKHCTGLPGAFVSGASMPIKRTDSTLPLMRTLIVSPVHNGDDRIAAVWSATRPLRYNSNE